ncbi:hypothetical protein K8R03_04410 [Candidatus Kaiserbacteria bacterium]|nr:hypothetical protein [Candidatus Kaiserbacteria bacterium]
MDSKVEEITGMTFASFSGARASFTTRTLVTLLCASMLLLSFPAISSAQAAASTPPAGQTQPVDTSCSLYSPSTWIYGCFWAPVLSALGALFLSMGIIFLQLAGLTFNTLVSWVIIKFAETLGSGGLNIMTAIDNGWTVFRDFSNILIIGMFVFIAISIILGIKEFGQKKMIANVLIIAVLINFSLLFTKVIIDFSNFTAFQIYQQMAKSSTGTFDLTSSFLKPMKITSVFDSYAAVRAIADGQGGSAVTALMYGIVGGLMLFGVAIVLFYGCFLIASRAILFIILMLSSPLAFASFLIPNFAKGDFGWSGWWKSLLNSAAFAPLIMLFLAASLSIISSASKVAGTGTLGALIQNPASQSTGDVWKIIFIYLLGTGLLFISFRLSSSFAGSISGFNLAQAIAASPLTQGARFIAAPILKNTRGRFALNDSSRLAKESKQASLDAGLAATAASQFSAKADRLARAGDHAGAFKFNQDAEAQKRLALAKQHDAAHLAEEAAKKAKVADSKFNLMDSAGAKALTKAVGLKGFAAGESSKGATSFKKDMEEVGKHAAEIAEKSKIGDAEKEEARRHATDEKERELETRRAARDDAAKNLAAQNAIKDQLEKTRDEIHKQVESVPEVQKGIAEVAAASASKAAAESAGTGRISSIEARIQAERDPTAQLRLHEELASAKGAHTVEMKQQESRISDAQNRLSNLKAQVGGRPLSDAENALQAAKTKFDALKAKRDESFREVEILEKNIKDDTKNLQKTIIAQAGEASTAAAGLIGRAENHPVLNKVPGVSYALDKLGSNAAAADAARSAFKKKQGSNARLSELLKNVDREEAAPPAAEPPAHG